MQMTTLGRTNLRVGRSAFGALPIQRLSEDEAAALLRQAYDGGINFYDTARAYSDSEKKIALGLGAMRKDVIIATKTAATTPDGLVQDLEASLAALNTDYIDIYQLHNIAQVPAQGSALHDSLLKAQAQGKIRFIGITCHLLTNARQALDGGLYDTIQFPLSALSSHEEIAFAKDCGKQNIGFIAMKALCGGLLTSAAPSMAYLRALAHVVPIWGFQHAHELEEVLALEKNPPALDDAMMARIQKDREELAGSFCRGCGYCLPCQADIRINWCARMPQLLRRAPYENFLSAEWQAEMEKIENCIECGDCTSRCPYSLEGPQLLRAALADYRQFSLDHA